MTSPARTDADLVRQPELLSSLGKLVRGLSALFWGLPIALVICVQTALGDWMRSLGILPPLLATGLLYYGLSLMAQFHPQERSWQRALDRARIFALVNVGLSPFLFWWNQVHHQPFFRMIVLLLAVCGVVFLFTLNPVLWRLAAMLPDETLRHETRVFTTVNRVLLVTTLFLLASLDLLNQFDVLPTFLLPLYLLKQKAGLWLTLFVLLLPLATTMALIWKIKEVILLSVFSADH